MGHPRVRLIYILDKEEEEEEDIGAAVAGRVEELDDRHVSWVVTEEPRVRSQGRGGITVLVIARMHRRPSADGQGGSTMIS